MDIQYLAPIILAIGGLVTALGAALAKLAKAKREMNVNWVPREIYTQVKKQAEDCTVQRMNDRIKMNNLETQLHSLERRFAGAERTIRELSHILGATRGIYPRQDPNEGSKDEY